MASADTHPESKAWEANASLYAPRALPILVTRLVNEPRPAWMESLIHEGRLWVDRRGWHAGSGEGRVDLDPNDYIILNETGELRICHPLAFRALFEHFESASQDDGLEDDGERAVIREWEYHHLRWLNLALPDPVEMDGKDLYALRPIAVLAASLSRKPWPEWLESLRDGGVIGQTRSGYCIFLDGTRADIEPDAYVVIDAAGKIESHGQGAFKDLFEPYEPTAQKVTSGDVFLNVAFHEGGVKLVTGYVRGWGGLRWRLSANKSGNGGLTVFGRDVDEEDGPREAWAIETSIDAGLAERAMGTDGPCVRSSSQRELAGVVAEVLSLVDVSVVRRSLLEELMATAPLPMGKRGHSR